MNWRTSAGVWAGTLVPGKRTRGVGVVANARAPIPAYLSAIPTQQNRTMRGAASDASPRILLLTSTLGSGHAAANRAIEAALLERAPTATVQTLDFWSLVDEGVAGAVRQAYLRLVSDDELVPQVESLLCNREELARIQRRAWALGRRDGAARIADLVLALAQSRIPQETLKAQ